jgi:hypothetical protein
MGLGAAFACAALFAKLSPPFYLPPLLSGTFLAADVYLQPLVALHNMIYIIIGLYHSCVYF